MYCVSQAGEKTSDTPYQNTHVSPLPGFCDLPQPTAFNLHRDGPIQERSHENQHTQRHDPLAGTLYELWYSIRPNIMDAVPRPIKTMPNRRGPFARRTLAERLSLTYRRKSLSASVLRAKGPRRFGIVLIGLGTASMMFGLIEYQSS